MYPAAKYGLIETVIVALVFSATTIFTMICAVGISYFGVAMISLKRIEKYTHALAGATVCLCGVAIQFLGL